MIGSILDVKNNKSYRNLDCAIFCGLGFMFLSIA